MVPVVQGTPTAPHAADTSPAKGPHRFDGSTLSHLRLPKSGIEAETARSRWSHYEIYGTSETALGTCGSAPATSVHVATAGTRSAGRASDNSRSRRTASPSASALSSRTRAACSGSATRSLRSRFGLRTRLSLRTRLRLRTRMGRMPTRESWRATRLRRAARRSTSKAQRRTRAGICGSGHPRRGRTVSTTARSNDLDRDFFGRRFRGVDIDDFIL